jgi:hypothetical protein
MKLHSEENNKKEVYSEPLLIKHGALLDITAASSGGGGRVSGTLFPPSVNYNINKNTTVKVEPKLDFVNGKPDVGGSISLNIKFP